MKRILLISLVLSIVCAAYAQTTFSVPTPTIEDKYILAKNFMYNNILVGISVAKSEGMTVEDFSTKCGDYFASNWDEEMGFEQFVNVVLSHMARLSDDVQIVEQSDDKIVFVSTPIVPQMENQDLIVWMDNVYGQIAKRFNLLCNMGLVEQGFQVDISK